MKAELRRIFGIIAETIAVSLAILLVTVLLAEGIIRLVNPFPKVQVIRRDRIQMFQEGDVPIWIQDLKRMNLDCPDRYPDARLVVFSGDSIFFGSGIQTEAAFTTLMQQELDRRDGPGSWCILNLSQPGYSVEQKIYWLANLMKKHTPDMVYWEVWPNESNRYRMIGDAAYDMAGVDGDTGRLPGFVPGPEWLRMWLFLNSRFFEYVVLTMFDLEPFRSSWVTGVYLPMLDEYRNALRARGSDFALVVATRLDMPFSQMRNPRLDPQTVTLEVASSHDMRMLFLHQLLLQAGADHMEIRYDPCCHFNEKGHRLLADIFLRIVAQDLDKTPQEGDTVSPEAVQGD